LINDARCARGPETLRFSAAHEHARRGRASCLRGDGGGLRWNAAAP